jgi:hypothetical protein
VQRFQIARCLVVGLNASAAALGFVIGAASLATGRPWWYGLAFLVQAVALGSMAFIFGRQTIVLTDDEIVATQGFQRQRVAWDAARLESALRERAATHGFAVEVTFPSWRSRGSDAGGA